jgi:phosphinothricin tripeptide acetyl hydrolase
MTQDLHDLLDFLRGFQVSASTAERRKNYDAASRVFPLPADYRLGEWGAEGVTGEHIRPPQAAADRAVLYLHGGGYTLGSPRSHRHLAAAIAAAAGAEAFVLDYRRAPEHPFPAALDDAVAAYRALAQDPARKIAIVGDSAGGGLSVSCAVAALAAGLRTPRGIACISPWTDLSLADVAPESDADPMMHDGENREYAANYLGAADPRDPRASPVYAALAGLPPLLIQVGSLEYLYRDSARLAARAREAGVTVELDVVEGVPHVWPWYWPKLQLGRDAVARIGQFLAPLLR